MNTCQLSLSPGFGVHQARAGLDGRRLVMTCLGCLFCSLLLGRPCAAHTISAPSDPALDALGNEAATAVAVSLSGLLFYSLLRLLVAAHERRRGRYFEERTVKSGSLAATIGVMLLLWRVAGPPPGSPAAVAAHTDTPQHGGQIAAAGDNHVELVTGPGGRVTLYLMGITETLPYPIPERVLRGQAQGAGGGTFPVALQAVPQAGEAAGQASAFVGHIPPEEAGGPLRLTVSVPLAGAVRQVTFGDGTPAHDTAAARVVATPVTAAERALFLTPGGAYTAADIAANGGLTPTQMFQDLMANHHLHPAKGAYVCPITKTQADRKFAWVVGGRTYLFCCPPCVAEFVKQAKAHPKGMHPPQSYVQG